jgi:AraC-like DNA-binding protein
MWHQSFSNSALSTIVQIVIFAGVLQGFFIALVLTAKKNRNRSFNRVLAILLTVLSLSILHSVIASGNADGPYKIKEPLILVIGPLLLFYVRECIGTKSTGLKNFLHFIPLLLFFLIALPFYVLGASSSYSQFIIQNSNEITSFSWTFIVAQYGFYWWKIVHILKDHMASVKSEFSSLEGKTLSWLRTFVHVFGILFGLFTGTVLLILHTSHYSAVGNIVSFGLSCVIFVLGYQGLLQEELFSNFQQASSHEKKTPEPVRYSIKEDRLSEKLVTYFEEKKPYLDESLTLTKLAEQLNVTRNQLSFVINNKFGSNFYTFVNKYRLEEVKRLLADPKNKNFTVLSLAFQAGFASKSSFNEIFKKFNGMTPTEYQNQLSESPQQFQLAQSKTS